MTAEENLLDRSLARQQRLADLFFYGYWVFVIFVFISGYGLIGVFLVPLGVRLFARRFADWLVHVAPGLWRAFAYRNWHGIYRAYDGWQVRIIDGEGHTPTQVVARDLFVLLGMTPNEHELRKIEIRYAPEFLRSEEEQIKKEWVFTDEGAIAFLENLQGSRLNGERAQTAQKLIQWLSREVFMPIDNKRSKDTGRQFRFTNQSLLGTALKK